MSLFHSVSKNFKDFFSDQEVYSQLQSIDLKKDFNRYSFLEKHPEEKEKFQKIFDLNVTRSNGQVLSVRQLLLESEFHQEDIILLKKIGFHQRNLNNPEVGLQLEHENLEGWLIKKNFGFFKGEKIIKKVQASGFPIWMLPSKLRAHSQVGVQAQNDVIHPLRVVMLERGSQWIDKLKLTNLKTAKEYLFLLSPIRKNNPLHKQVVVISKKVNVLNDYQNIRRFANLAERNPNELKKIAEQIVLFIKHTHLTDMHLYNLRFKNNQSNKIFILDGEPIGALADREVPLLVRAFKEYDPAFFPLLGLKYLKIKIPEQLRNEGICPSTIQKVQAIFDPVIDQMISEIIFERSWHFLKKITMIYFPVLDPIFMLFALIRTIYLQFSKTPSREVA